MKTLTRQGILAEEEGMIYLTELETESALPHW